MKYFVIGIVILCILLSGCWWSGREIQNRTAAVIRPLELALDAFQAGEDAEGQRFAAEAVQQWHHSDGVLSSLLSHERINVIDAALADLQNAARPESAQVCKRLIRSIRKLAEQETPSWRNIF